MPNLILSSQLILFKQKKIHFQPFKDIWLWTQDLNHLLQFYSHLNMKGITEEDYIHAQQVQATFELKTMENITKYSGINLVTNEKAYRKKLVKLNFKSGIQFSSNLIGCEMGKISVIMNKPVYLRQVIIKSKLKPMTNLPVDHRMLSMLYTAFDVV